MNFLKEVFKHTELKLAVIDVDIFSAQRALQINYDYGHNQIVCLVKVEEKKVQFTILKGRNFFLTQDVAIPSTSSARENSDSVVRLIAKELRRIVLDYQLGKQVDDLNELFLYGEAVDDSLLESLQNSYDVHINRANPFRRIKLASQPPEDTNSMHAERYLISVGAALRGIQ